MDQPWVYIVLFGLVFIVYAMILPKSGSNEGKTAPSIAEIEATMDHFASELEEQNRKLLDRLDSTKKEYELQIAKLGTAVDRLEEQQSPLKLELEKLRSDLQELEAKTPRQTDTTQSAALKAVLVPEVGPINEEIMQADANMNMKKRYAELFLLHDQGKSTDVIARKLNMTKGEVSLIIQLAKQEEKLHAQ